MSRAAVKLYHSGNVVAETTLQTTDPEGNMVEVTDALVDQWADGFRVSSLTLAALKVDSWDVVEFDVNGSVYSRNY